MRVLWTHFLFKNIFICKYKKQTDAAKITTGHFNKKLFYSCRPEKMKHGVHSCNRLLVWQAVYGNDVHKRCGLMGIVVVQVVQ